MAPLDDVWEIRPLVTSEGEPAAFEILGDRRQQAADAKGAGLRL